MKDMTHEQLIRATYVVAKYENPKTAQLLTELAGRLDCALVAARTACLERDSAVRAEVEWEAAMRQAVGEDGVDDVVVAIEKLKAALDVQSARSDALAAELARYSMSAGDADQRMAESRAVRQALGFGQDADDVAPVDLVERINALAAENAALKSGQLFFMYSDETGFEIHKSQERAIASAKDMIAVCREEAVQDGWPEDADTICWGVIMQKAIETNFEKPSEQNGWIGWSEYNLNPELETPTTDAWVNEQRAAGVEKFVSDFTEPAVMNDGKFYSEDLIEASKEFAAQLRGSQV
ncbi:hypothetical protein [Atlantibacter hermannii]|uniref:hypothetical protein n=1 Tax=Atlantibacter hermannii TaxID=565 RepID=UPI0028A150E9|nr:hypothetical protein [Atlantibacter hermannii]